MSTVQRDRLGRYELLTELGRGAMGTVYKARDPMIDRLVAIKTISMPGRAVEEAAQFRERFFREARAAGRLSHPGIVTIHNVDEDPEAGPYIVMEYVAGQTLDRIISDGIEPIPIVTALDLSEQLAQALHYAHAQGIVHRDIKPANIIVTDDGRAKIADFGVAKLDLSQFTAQGVVFGTPSFMSPEQLEGENVDARSDLFSLGVVLYSMLTGYRPFQGNSAATISFKVVYKEPVPVSALNSALHVDLDYVVDRALAKSPDRRYHSGEELALDLQDVKAGKPPRSRDPKTEGIVSADQTAVQRVALKRGRGADAVLARKLAGIGKALRWSHGQMAKKLLIAGSAAVLGVGGWAIYRTVRVSSATVQTAAPPVTPGEAPAVRSAAPQSPAPASLNTVGISVHVPFASAEVTIWVDSKLTYQRHLLGQTKKRMWMVKSVEGNLSGSMAVPSGRHTIRVQVSSDAEHYRNTASIRADFDQGQHKTLNVNFHGRSREMSVSLD